MIFVLSGGIGKIVAFSAILPALAKAHKEIIVVSGYPDVFDGLKEVRRSLDYGAAYGYEDIVKGREICWPEPYHNPGYFLRKRSLIQSWCDVCGVEWDDSMRPQVRPSVLRAPKTGERFGRFVLVQFFGGNSQYSQQVKPANLGQVRDYIQGAELVKAIKKTFPDVKVVVYDLPIEQPVRKLPDGREVRGYEGAEDVQGLHYMAAWALLREAAAFVAIDSSLHHMAAALRIRGVVIWEATDPKLLGYPDQVNIEGACDRDDPHCMRPWTAQVLDNLAQGRPWECPSRACADIPPERVVEELAPLLRETTKKAKGGEKKEKVA